MNLERITLILADDHPMLLQGMEQALSAKGYQIVGLASNGASALKQILIEEPKIAILDQEMPFMNGLEVIATAKAKGVKTAFILLTFHKSITYLAYAEMLHLDGYLLKEDSLEEIVNCIHKILEGERYVSKAFNEKNRASAKSVLRSLQTLTPSEIRILKLLALGKSTQSVAEQLFVSARTIDKHRSNIINKLASDHSIINLSVWAMENKELINGL